MEMVETFLSILDTTSVYKCKFFFNLHKMLSLIKIMRKKCVLSGIDSYKGRQVLFHTKDSEGRENEQSYCFSFAKLDKPNRKYIHKNRLIFDLQIEILEIIPHNQNFGMVDFP
jgi:hypothetical protein